MTPQQKAEQYVRGKLPELRELSFGCEVARHPIGGYKYLRRVGNSFKTGYTDAYVLRDTKVEVYPAKDLKIIGHPIQLQHWLSVLDSKFNPKSKVMAGNLWIYIGNTDIVFNLITGQPLTEADYQAFNEIVGI